MKRARRESGLREKEAVDGEGWKELERKGELDAKWERTWVWENILLKEVTLKET